MIEKYFSGRTCRILGWFLQTMKIHPVQTVLVQGFIILYSCRNIWKNIFQVWRHRGRRGWWLWRRSSGSEILWGLNQPGAVGSGCLCLLFLVRCHRPGESHLFWPETLSSLASIYICSNDLMILKWSTSFYSQSDRFTRSWSAFMNVWNNH